MRTRKGEKVSPMDSERFKRDLKERTKQLQTGQGEAHPGEQVTFGVTPHANGTVTFEITHPKATLPLNAAIHIAHSIIIQIHKAQAMTAQAQAEAQNLGGGKIIGA